MKSGIARRGWALLLTDGFIATLKALRTKLIRSARRVESVDEALIVAEHFLTSTDGRRTGVMFDVGAHHGSVLAPFAMAGWMVHAFEPDSQNRKRIEIAFGELPNVIIDDRAVSNTTGERVAFYQSAQSTGISGLSAFHESHEIAGYIETVSLADYIHGTSLSTLDFLKIDAEGYDLRVLQGIDWDRIKPRVIVCEFEDKKTRPLGYTYDELTAYLTDLGYQILVSEWHPIARYGEQHRWRRAGVYPYALEDSSGWGNLICAHDSIEFEKLVRRFESALPKPR